MTKSEGMVSALGMRLNILSNEKGSIRRSPTSPHNAQLIHLGIFLKTALIMITATARYEAVMLILMISVKIILVRQVIQ